MPHLNKFIVVFFILLFPFKTYPQSDTGSMEPGYYVVIAAYADTKENFAIAYVNKLTKQGHSAHYGFDAIRSYYYVYLNYHSKLKEALLDMQSVRNQGKFTDAWVRVIPGNIGTRTDNRQVDQDQQKKISDEENKTADKQTNLSDTITYNQLDSEQIRADSASDRPMTVEVLREGALTLANSEVFFSLYNARNERIIDGEVNIIDTERAHLIKRVKGNEYVTMPDPKSKSGRITLIGEVFGYRKIQHELDFDTPMVDTTLNFVELVGTTYVVNFDMVRYRKGDIATLYNVYFYNDAALMLPESKYELNSLLELMKEKDYKIKLHGHSNGNYLGKIISMGEDKDFFSIKGDVKSSMGSAKKLSELRAQVIKDYLIANGIAASRILIKAWGGKRPIYDRNGPNAKKNVRVEVEILED